MSAIQETRSKIMKRYRAKLKKALSTLQKRCKHRRKRTSWSRPQWAGDRERRFTTVSCRDCGKKLCS